MNGAHIVMLTGALNVVWKEGSLVEIEREDDGEVEWVLNARLRRVEMWG